MNKFSITSTPEVPNKENPVLYYVYKLEFFDMYYFGVTSDIQSRISVHYSVIANSLLNGKCVSSIPFHHKVFDYCIENNIRYRKARNNLKASLLKKFKSKIWAISYEEKYITDNIHDPNCKNVFTISACKSKGRECVTYVFIDNGKVYSNFCIRCGHSIK